MCGVDGAHRLGRPGEGRRECPALGLQLRRGRALRVGADRAGLRRSATTAAPSRRSTSARTGAVHKPLPPLAPGYGPVRPRGGQQRPHRGGPGAGGRRPRLEVGERTYRLVQFHWHTPSEHWLDGEPYPMELHLVHADENGLLVLGALVERGPANPELEKLWAVLPRSRATTPRSTASTSRSSCPRRSTPTATPAPSPRRPATRGSSGSSWPNRSSCPRPRSRPSRSSSSAPTAFPSATPARSNRATAARSRPTPTCGARSTAPWQAPGRRSTGT